MDIRTRYGDWADWCIVFGGLNIGLVLFDNVCIIPTLLSLNECCKARCYHYCLQLRRARNVFDQTMNYPACGLPTSFHTNLLASAWELSKRRSRNQDPRT